MALTDSAIAMVRGLNQGLLSSLIDYYRVANDTLNRVKEEPEFAKYLVDTESGARILAELKALLQQAEETRNHSENFCKGTVENFLHKQKMLNDAGR